MTTISIAGKAHDFDEAFDVVVGYALGMHHFESQAYPGAPSIHGDEPLFGFRTYDCVPGSSGAELEDVDLLVAAGLNGQVDIGAVAGLQFAAADASVRLKKLATHDVVFGQVDKSDLLAFPSGDGPGRWLWEAWAILMRAPNVGVALTHKVLHHKMPDTFPLIDGQTLGRLQDAGSGSEWVGVWNDLQGENGEVLADLVTRFNELIAEEAAEAFPGFEEIAPVPLRLLRVHDILLWCDTVPKMWDRARGSGSQILHAIDVHAEAASD